METPNYNKEHVLRTQLKDIETLEERVKIASKHLSEEVEFFKLVSTELRTAAEVVIPSMKTYLNTVRDVRMSFAREVQEILRSSQELTTITKSAPAFSELCEVVIKLDRSLSSDLINKIKNTFNVTGDK